MEFQRAAWSNCRKMSKGFSIIFDISIILLLFVLLLLFLLLLFRLSYTWPIFFWCSRLTRAHNPTPIILQTGPNQKPSGHGVWQSLLRKVATPERAIRIESFEASRPATAKTGPIKHEKTAEHFRAPTPMMQLEAKTFDEKSNNATHE